MDTFTQNKILENREMNELASFEPRLQVATADSKDNNARNTN